MHGFPCNCWTIDGKEVVHFLSWWSGGGSLYHHLLLLSYSSSLSSLMLSRTLKIGHNRNAAPPPTTTTTLVFSIHKCAFLKTLSLWIHPYLVAIFSYLQLLFPQDLMEEKKLNLCCVGGVCFAVFVSACNVQYRENPRGRGQATATPQPCAMQTADQFWEHEMPL